MGLRDARPKIVALKDSILKRFPEIELHEGWGFDGSPQDVYLYAYAAEDKMDGIIEMSSPRILDILLETNIFVHVIPLNPGTMSWLFDDGKKRPRRVARSAASGPQVRAVAESRSKYVAKPRKKSAGSLRRSLH